jgi:hypothetical protein
MMNKPTKLMVSLAVDDWLEVDVKDYHIAKGGEFWRHMNESEMYERITTLWELTDNDIDGEFANGYGEIDEFKASALRHVMAEVDWGDVVDALEAARKRALERRAIDLDALRKEAPEFVDEDLEADLDTLADYVYGELRVVTA